MFEKLYSLVKENLGAETINKAQVPAKFHEAMVNEASGTIIDVLKSHIDKGKYNDLWNVFVSPCPKNIQLVSSISKKYAMRLNKHYGIAVDKAQHIAEDTIPAIMEKFFSMYRTEDNGDRKGIFTLFNNLSGNRINYEVFLNKITHPLTA